MSLRTDLQAWLKGRAAISAVVGTNVFWCKAKQGTPPPFITFQRIAGPRLHVLDTGTRLAMPIYQIDGWTLDPDQIEALSDAILGIDGFRGTMGSTVVRAIELVGDRDLGDAPLGASDVGFCRCSYDFEIMHEETV